MIDNIDDFLLARSMNGGSPSPATPTDKFKPTVTKISTNESPVGGRTTIAYSASADNFDFIQVDTMTGTRRQSWVIPFEMYSTLCTWSESARYQAELTMFEPWEVSNKWVTFYASLDSMRVHAAGNYTAVSDVYGLSFKGLTSTTLYKSSSESFNDAAPSVGSTIELADDIYNYDFISVFINSEGGTNYYSASTYRAEDFILTDTSYAAMKEAWKSAYIQNPDNYKTGVHSEFGYNSSGDWSYADNTLTCVSPGKFNLQWIIGFKLP